MKYQRNAGVETAPMMDETILYDPRSVKFCALNGTAAYLWERLAAPRAMAELINELEASYSLRDRGEAERDVQRLLDEFVQLAFVAVDAPSSTASTPVALPPRAAAADPRSLPAYGSPQIRIMDESEVLTAFQVTSAGISWWVM